MSPGKGGHRSNRPRRRCRASLPSSAYALPLNSRRRLPLISAQPVRCEPERCPGDPPRQGCGGAPAAFTQPASLQATLHLIELVAETGPSSATSITAGSRSVLRSVSLRLRCRGVAALRLSPSACGRRRDQARLPHRSAVGIDGDFHGDVANGKRSGASPRESGVSTVLQLRRTKAAEEADSFFSFKIGGLPDQVRHDDGLVNSERAAFRFCRSMPH